MRKRLKAPSPAMIVACIALFLAITGAGAAAMASHYVITSTHQIKPTVLAKLRGAKGPAGPRGATGAAGAAGAAGATNVVVRTAEDTSAWSLLSVVTANCNPGEVATGGGADWDTTVSPSGFPVVTASIPYPNAVDAKPTGWTAMILNGSDSGYVRAIAWVVCASP
jgi:hypothetical protein